MNIAEILKDCPKGTKLYSPLLGEVELYDIDNTINVTLPTTTFTGTFHFFLDGRYWDFKDSECLLFPSKDNRDWSTFKAPKQESEDERIRKELIRMVNIWTYSCPTVNGIPVETLLAWLEKQKRFYSDYEESELRRGLLWHLKELQNIKKSKGLPIKSKATYDDWISWLEKQGV